MQVFKTEYIFEAENFHTKEDVLNFIASKAVQLSLSESKDVVLKALIQRENEFSTGMEKGFAIPHCQSDAIKRPALFFIRSTNALKWQTFDQSDVKYMFVILIPKENKDNLHMQTLTKVSTILLNENLINILKTSIDKNEIYQLISLFINEEKNNINSVISGKKVVGITSCAVGIAHTYLSAETLTKKLIELGYQPKIETRGSVGVQNQLTNQDIAEAEFVIIASDVKIPLDEFNNKKVYVTSTKEAIHKTEEVINKALKSPVFYSNNKVEKTYDTTKQGILKHIIKGISYMIPYVIFGGIMIAISLGLGKSIYGNNTEAPKGDFLWWLLQIGVVSFTLMIGALGAYIAYSIAGRAEH
ncbi:PTS system fructose-specific IIC component [Mycoplasmopsis mustelae]|uniref:PTS system fructose-specific IIC component n=1 Tax=Mycoplasmopsis mustelae TaxID=171289 RepID=A0A4R7UF09_9BACT|nr:fructose PTS transporter subunit IIA [Mycoplasmopsis mustelae]TDV24491.1 PTS system fructose-specific IIC component [Mycoplasmopsis mustelae]